MDSPDRPRRHLHATADHEVVFCHACSNEWYRDEHGLQCPSCDSDITEIVSPENDPRDLDHHTSASTSPEVPLFRYDDNNSDPDEPDIEEHLGPHGFHFRRSTRDGGPGDRHHDPAVDPVLERFLGMIQDFGPPRRVGGGGLFRQEGEGRLGEPHVHRTTFTTGNTSVTIFSGHAHGLFGGAESPAAVRRADPFQAFFSNVLRDLGPPEGQEQPGGPAPTFARGLQEILNLFNPANAVAGDAVYSQEALDQIITNLMEAHPQSNAAPPASAEALANLNRRRVELSMLEGDSKTECAICIDDMNEGDTAAFLPCKHWFHDECVVLWLKEHNTCPVCRASIEGRGGGGSGSGNGNGNGNGSSSSSTRGPGVGISQPAEDLSPGGMNRSSPLPIPGVRPSQIPRPPSQSQTRLNEAMRSISTMQQERDRERDGEWGTTSGFSYNTSRLQRRSSRNSLSPTSPRMPTFADYRARTRQRSPSQSSRRESGNGDSGRQSGSGPLNWLRDQFSGRGGSSQDSSREER